MLVDLHLYFSITEGNLNLLNTPAEKTLCKILVSGYLICHHRVRNISMRGHFQYYRAHFVSSDHIYKDAIFSSRHFRLASFSPRVHYTRAASHIVLN